MTQPISALPEPGAQSPDDLAAISHRFAAHSKEALCRGDRLQESEKVWGAVNYALKAIAMQRGWAAPGLGPVWQLGGILSAGLS